MSSRGTYKGVFLILLRLYGLDFLHPMNCILNDLLADTHAGAWGLLDADWMIGGCCVGDISASHSHGKISASCSHFLTVRSVGSMKERAGTVGSSWRSAD